MYSFVDRTLATNYHVIASRQVVQYYMKASLVLMLASHMKSSPREPATKVFYRVQYFFLHLGLYLCST